MAVSPDPAIAVSGEIAVMAGPLSEHAFSTSKSHVFDCRPVPDRAATIPRAFDGRTNLICVSDHDIRLSRWRSMNPAVGDPTSELHLAILTALLDVKGPKPVPLIVIVLPVCALSGVTPVIWGRALKF
jgi:hypothetical protein